MAWGDHSRLQNQVDYQGGLAQNHLNNLRTDTIVPQNQQFWNDYLTANTLGRQQQSGLMNAYGNVAGNAMSQFGPAYAGFSNLANSSSGGFDPEFRKALSSSLGGYQDFANTGGYSPQNIQDIRARSLAPIRATYANANADVDRARKLQGGYSPNYTAAKAKMARDLSYNLGDASTNVEAGLAEAIRAGKLQGLSGMTQTSATGQGLQNAIDSLNLQGKATGLSGMNSSTSAGLSALLGALSGASNVYGQAPGLASMASGNVNQSTNAQLQLAQLQNALGLGIIGGQNQVSQTPGNFQSAMGNIASGLGLAGQIGGMATGLGGMIGQPRSIPGPFIGPQV